MIPRYATPEMTALWSDSRRFEVWLEVERLAVEGLAEAGLAPAEAARAIRAAPIRIDPARVAAIEADVRHDLAAFVSHVQEQLGDEGRWVHFGLTSSDVVDTAGAVLLRDALGIVLDDVRGLRRALLARAREHRRTICMGRTHGVHAEPTTFGLKLLGHVAECDRNLDRLERARAAVSVGKVSGPVGTYSTVPPAVEAHVCRGLGLAPERAATQVVPRDRHAEALCALALLGAGLERLATELRHLQRTEVGEAEEPFADGQKGSSAMPHKRNPVGLENICGLARLLRGYAVTGLENVALWHERDISHSSAERVALPDATTLASYATRRLTGIVSGLVVRAERMRSNVEASGGLWASASVLLALVEAGLARDEAYRVVQRAATAARDGAGAFRDLLLADADVRGRLDAAALDRLLDPARLLAHVDEIFARFED